MSHSQRRAADTAEPAAGRQLGLGVLSRLVDASLDGIAVLDAERRYVYVNASGAEILGSPVEQLLGRRAEDFDGPQVGTDLSGPDLTSVTLMRTPTPREIEYGESAFDVDGDALAVVVFRDVTAVRGKQRQLRAFARTASSIAYEGSLSTVLGEIAQEIRHATGLACIAVVLIDPETKAFDVAGTSGGYPDDYTDRLEAARRLGAPLMTLETFESRRSVVVPNWRHAILEDERFAPVHSFLEGQDWGTFVAAPLAVRGRYTGVITGFYPEASPEDEADLAFMTAMADQAAVAVENTRLLAELEQKAALEERHRLARELHDSVSQTLFSLTLQTKAVRLAHDQVGDGRHDRVEHGLNEIAELTEAAFAEMRSLIYELRPDALHEVGLVSAIRRQLRGVVTRHGLQVELNEASEELEFDHDTERELYRIIQEAINNAIRHARATSLRVNFDVARAGRPKLVVEVTDDGVGFDTRDGFPGHFGLVTMKERAERIGAEFGVTSAPGTSTTIRIEVPIADGLTSDSTGTSPNSHSA